MSYLNQPFNFLSIKNKSSCFLTGEPRRVFQVFPCFTFLRCFYFSAISGFFIFHLSQLFIFYFFSGVSISTFLRCFHFSSFSAVFVFLYRECFFYSQKFFILYSFPIWHSTTSATDFRELFLLSGFFHLTFLPNICENLLWSRLPWEPTVLPRRLQGL